MALLQAAGMVSDSMQWPPIPITIWSLQLTPTRELGSTILRIGPVVHCESSHCVSHTLFTSYHTLCYRIKEDHAIMSFTLSKDARYALLNVASQVHVCMPFVSPLPVHPVSVCSGCAHVGPV